MNTPSPKFDITPGEPIPEALAEADRLLTDTLQELGLVIIRRDTLDALLAERDQALEHVRMWHAEATVKTKPGETTVTSAASSQGFAWLYRYFRGKVDGPHGRSIYRDRPRSRREAFGLARAYYRKRVIG